MEAILYKLCVLYRCTVRMEDLSEEEQKPKFMNVQFFAEVSGHNLESSQTRDFCMDLLNHREGDMVFYQVFLLSLLQCTVSVM